MKAIILIQSKLVHNRHLGDFSKSMYDLKVYGKELLSYYLDLLNELLVDEIDILSTDAKKYIEPYYKSELFSPKINFFDEESIEDYYTNNISKFKDDSLLIIENFGCILNKSIEIENKIRKQKENFYLKDGNFKIAFFNNHLSNINKKPDSSILNIKELKSLDDYVYILDKTLNNIEDFEHFVGYNNENGIVIGKNVILNKNIKLIPPVVIQDNVKILDNCTIGPKTFVSNNIYIEKNTSISNSIIFDNTYIGTNLSFDNKLVIEDTLFDKETQKSHKVDKRLISKNN